MSDLENLLRRCPVEYGHIQLFRDETGWQASVCHYNPNTITNSRAMEDPVEALCIALADDQSKCRDIAQRYADAPKMGDADDFEGLFE